MIKPIYSQQGETAILNTSYYCNSNDGKYYAYENLEQTAGMPKVIPMAVAENFHNQNKIIFQKMMNQQTGIMIADSRNGTQQVRLEANSNILPTQKLEVVIDASAYTGATAFFVVSLGGGNKTAKLLNLASLPTTDGGVTISGTDGTDTLDNFNDFAKRGFVLKGCQISATNQSVFASTGKVLQYFGLQTETASDIVKNAVSLSYGIDPSANSPQFRKLPEQGEGAFYAKCDPLQGILLGCPKGQSVTFTFTFYSSANSAAVYELAPR